MTAPIVATADAIVTRLNDAVLGFTAERHFVPNHKTEDLESLTVLIVPRSEEIARLGRQQHNDRLHISVYVGKQTTYDDLAAIDANLDLLETIKANLLSSVLPVPGLATMPVVQAELVLFDEEQLHSSNTFAGMLTVVYEYTSGT